MTLKELSDLLPDGYEVLLWKPEASLYTVIRLRRYHKEIEKLVSFETRLPEDETQQKLLVLRIIKEIERKVKEHANRQ